MSALTLWTSTIDVEMLATDDRIVVDGRQYRVIQVLLAPPGPEGSVLLQLSDALSGDMSARRFEAGTRLSLLLGGAA